MLSAILSLLFSLGYGRGGSYFLHDWEFWENFLAYRKLGIIGRLRGGKTSLAVAIARRLWLEGRVRGVFSNFPIDPKYIPQVRSCVNTAVILDETHEFADARLSATNRTRYGAYFGKFGSWLISPSVYKMDYRLADIRATRTNDLFLFGVWHYTFWIPDSSEHSGEFLGWFWWKGFEEVFKAYDHRFIPKDDGGILETLEREIKEYSGSYRPVLTPDDWDEYWRDKRVAESARERVRQERRAA